MTPGTMAVRTVDPGNPEEASRWNSYIQASPQATLSHRIEWLRVIRRVFGHATYPLALFDSAGNITGVLPLVFFNSLLFGRFLVSVPFVNYGGVIADGHQEASLLIAEAEELRQRLAASHVELRHSNSVIENIPTKSHKVCLTLDLMDSAELQWKSFDSKTRNQIRKAQKNDLTVKFGSLDLLDDFYEVFTRNMRDLGTPVYHRNFFKEIINEFNSSSKIVVTYKDNNAVAAGIILWDETTVEIPWASSIREFNTFCPNNIMYWEIIKFSINSKFKNFDFGRSTPGGGTYKFKTQWGAYPVALRWQYLLAEDKSIPDITPSNPRYKAAISTWKRLPVPLTKLIGPHIVRNIP